MNTHGEYFVVSINCGRRSVTFESEVVARRARLEVLNGHTTLSATKCKARGRLSLLVQKNGNAPVLK